MDTVSARRSPIRQWRSPLTFIVILWAMFGQLALGAPHLSMTSDEPPHWINGYVMLTTGDAWAVPVHGHPPLLNLWSAWPLLLQPERPDPRALPHWHTDFIKFVREMWPLFGPIERTAFVTRVPIMLLACVLLALVYRWAREWFGAWGGGLAIGVMAFDPTLIAHAQLDTTDLGVTLFIFASLYLTQRLLKRFAWRWPIGIGLTLGAACASKPSGLLLAPVIGLLMGWGCVREIRAHLAGPGARPLGRVGRWIGAAGLVSLIGFLVLWAAYRFEWSVPPLATHLRMLAIFFQVKHGVSFLNGALSTDGWWWYFPFAALIKSPLPYLIGVGAALWLAIRRYTALGHDLALWLFPLVYWSAALRSDINLGYRHLLPTFPFVYVGLARLGPLLGSRRVARGLGLVLGAWYILGALAVYPFPLAYFNELVGGPKNGYRYLVDSNVDWGQSFKALRAYMEQANIASVRLSYYTWIDPAAYGVRYEPLPPHKLLPRRFEPEPGVYAISATTLQGAMMQDPTFFEWFRHRQPTAQPGYGLLVYQVEPREPRPTWAAQCSAPAAALEPEQIAQGLGRADMRLAYFDCTSSWLIPDGGRSAGWYVVPRRVTLDRFMARWLQPSRLSYRQMTDQAAPAFSIYEQNARPLEATCSGAPQATDGPLNLLGHAAPTEARAGAPVEIETCWQVTRQPQRPLSIMLHLVGPDGQHRVADGLGVPIEQWQVGDLLVQRHRLTLPPDLPAGAFQLLTGAYWLDTLERWSVAAGGDTLSLGSITVQVRR